MTASAHVESRSGMTIGPLDLILVFIPTYNDVELLADLSAELQRLGTRYRTLIVDDGSSASIDVSTLAPGTMYCRLPANFGVGIATHVAFDHALRHGYQAVVRLDADGQHPIEHIPKLLEPIQNKGADLVVGVRLNRHEGSSIRAFAAGLVRRYLSVVSCIMTRARAPKDVNSGFFAVSAYAISRINRVALERYPEPQLYVLAGRQKLSIVEIPMKQQSRRHGSSTITLGRALGMFYRFNIFILGELLQRSKSE